MMESEILWITPLLMLPGIATLIISTSARYAGLHEEIHRWLDGSHDTKFIEQAHLITRAVHFRNALVAQYISVFILVCCSLLGVVLDMAQIPGDALLLLVFFTGIVAVGYASYELIRESRFSLAVIQSHVNQLMDGEDA